MTALDDCVVEARSALAQSVLLIVGEPGDHLSGDGSASATFDIGQVRLRTNAADSLKALATDWVDRVEGAEVLPFTATAELERDQVFVIDDPEDLADIAPLYELGNSPETLPVRNADELAASIKLYGLTAGDSNRIIFLRRSDPRIGYTPDRPLLATFSERLKRIDEPVFWFYRDFHMILAQGWAVVADQRAFEMLFRDFGLIEARIDTWIETVATGLPWADGSIAALRKVALKDSRTWRRLQEIHKRDHLKHVEIDDILDYATAMEMSLENLVVDNKIVFEPSERFSILHLLNEDLFIGALTEARFEAQRKTGM